MNFALTPDDGRPPRLIRFGDLPGNTLSTYDHENNLLVVDRDLYERLNADQKRALERTHEPRLVFGSVDAELELNQLDMFDALVVDEWDEWPVYDPAPPQAAE